MHHPIKAGLSLAAKDILPTRAAYDLPFLTSMICEAMQQAGVGLKNPDNPLEEIIDPGMSVLLKPNWVHHRNEGKYGMDSMITHPSFILAVLQLLAKAKPRKIILGDAPIQGCDWNALISPQFIEQIEEAASPIPVDLIDFRRTALKPNGREEEILTNQRDMKHYVLFDLGSDSLLEPISKPAGRFRVTMYNPRELAKTHQPGRHQYLLCKEPFEADIILNLPKLKTHRKVCLTGALKNLVGLNGNKDYLPHHRVGGSLWGGDCYPGLSPLKRLAEFFLDQANQKMDTPEYRWWKKWAYRFLSWHERLGGDAQIEGAWYGNDTAWRMALDLNRILLYGQSDGSLSDNPQRQIWSLTDAIVCGQAEGPLRPEPFWCGAVTFTNSSALADYIHATLLGLDPERIPLLKHAFDEFRWPLETSKPKIEITCQQRMNGLEEIWQKTGQTCKPPRGWIGHCEKVQ